MMMIMHDYARNNLPSKQRGTHAAISWFSASVLASGIAPSPEYVVGGEVHRGARSCQ